MGFAGLERRRARGRTSADGGAGDAGVRDMMVRDLGPVAYVMKRYPRLSETFILNEIRTMERLGADLHIFSLMQTEPPPHHTMVREVKAPVHALPATIIAKLASLLRAHAAAVAAAPRAYLRALGYALIWTARSPSPFG